MDCARLFCWLFVAVQVALPLKYYIWNDDPFDESYAWRMFSVTSRSASYVEWYYFLESDEGIPIQRIDIAKLGVPTHWVDMIMGYGKPGLPATPHWVLKRVAVQLCELLPQKPEALQARRVIVPLHGDPMFENATQWDCT